MKALLKYSFLFCLLTVISCKKDCTPPTFEENIVGTWNGTANSLSGTKSLGKATLNSDHTGTSPGELFQTSINGGPPISDFTWELKGDTTLALIYKKGSSTNTYFYKVLKNECDEIKLNYLFGDLYLSRQ